MKKVQGIEEIKSHEETVAKPCKYGCNKGKPFLNILVHASRAHKSEFINYILPKSCANIVPETSSQRSSPDMRRLQ